MSESTGDEVVAVEEETEEEVEQRRRRLKGSSPSERKGTEEERLKWEGRGVGMQLEDSFWVKQEKGRGVMPGMRVSQPKTGLLMRMNFSKKLSCDFSE